MTVTEYQHEFDQGLLLVMRTCTANTSSSLHQDRSTTSTIILQALLSEHESGIAVLG